MRNKGLNNNLTDTISKGGVLYRPGEIPVLTKEQLAQANLVSKLPHDFPFANWEGMTTKQQLQQMKYSGLNPQEQWSLLNANVPLGVLKEHNQAQEYAAAQATPVQAPALLSAKAVQSLAQNIQNASTNSSISPSLQTSGFKQKLNILKEEYKENPLGKASGSVGASVAPKAVGNVRANVGLKLGSSASRDAMDRKKDKILGQVNGTPSTYPPKSVATPLPKLGASPIIPATTPTPYPVNAEYAYVFYTQNPGSEFLAQAKYQKQILESKGYKVKLICTNSAPAFSNAWNNMDPKAGAAVILSHSNGMSLLFQEGTKTNAISATGRTINDKSSLMKISDLKGPELAFLYILACNAGHQELLKYKGTNVADAFRDLPNVDKVYAYDGSVGFGIPFISADLNPRLALDQNGYFAVFNNFDIPYKLNNPSGQLLYDDEN